MVFTLFRKTGEIHFDHNGIDDYDGDDGYFDEVDVPDAQVHKDVAEMIYENYFAATIKVDIMQRIYDMIDDIDAWESAIEYFDDELKHKYAREYG